MSARITTIAGEIAAMIDAMATTGGYNYNWSNVNEPDAAQKKTFPSAVVRYKGESAAEGTSPTLYGFQNAEFSIEVEQKIAPSVTFKPEFTSDDALDKCLADLRKCFAQNLSGYLPLSKEAVITFVSSEKVENTRGNTYRPVKLVTKWNVFYHNA